MKRDQREDRPYLVDRRVLPDRRRRPTTLSSAARRGGRRQGFRRANEGQKAFVDCPSLLVIVLGIWVVLASALDALFTPLRLAEGFSELNPLMAVTVAYGPAVFVATKMAVSTVGAWLLVAHQQYQLAYRGLYSLALMYVGVVGIHGVLILTSC